MNLDYAKQWADALGNDTDKFADLYAADGQFTSDVHMMDDHMEDTASSREQLVAKRGPLAPGDHPFAVTEYLGDERWGMIHWDYTVQDADINRGILAAVKTLSMKGLTCLRCDADGKIVLE